MNEMIAKAEQALLERQKLPEIFAAGLVRPSYDGLGLANIAALTLELLCPDASTLNGHSTLPAFNPELLGVKSVTEAWQNWLGQAPINHVVLLIMDALGYEQLKVLMSQGDTPRLAQACMKDQAFFMPGTSVFPSTTVTALTSAATALAPAQHGLVNTHVYFQEIGSLANLIGFRPSVTPTSTPYLDTQLNPDTLLPVPNIYVLMEKAGINVEIINYYQFKHSSISRFTSAGSNAATNGYFGYLTPADAFSQLRDRLTIKTTGNKSFTYVYIPNVDTFAHRYAPLSNNYRAEIAAIDFSLHRELFEPLAGREDTVLIMTADHGQRPVYADKIAWLDQHPNLVKNLFVPFTGATQARNLHINKGAETIVFDYVQQHLQEQFLLLSKAEAIELGLLGLAGENLSEASSNRVGDAVLIPKGDWVGLDDDTHHYAIGTHGGLSLAEMLIPFFAYRF